MKSVVNTHLGEFLLDVEEVFPMELVTPEGTFVRKFEGQAFKVLNKQEYGPFSHKDFLMYKPQSNSWEWNRRQVNVFLNR